LYILKNAKGNEIARAIIDEHFVEDKKELKLTPRAITITKKNQIRIKKDKSNLVKKNKTKIAKTNAKIIPEKKV